VTSRPVSYRSRIALYVVVVVSVMAAKRIRFKPRQSLFYAVVVSAVILYFGSHCSI